MIARGFAVNEDGGFDDAQRERTVRGPALVVGARGLRNGAAIAHRHVDADGECARAANRPRFALVRIVFPDALRCRWPAGVGN